MSHLLIFTTYAWDDFIRRQFERAQSRVGSGNICIVADETHGPIANLPTEFVIRTSKSETLDQCGLRPLTEMQPLGSKPVFWWNLDYLTYRVVKEYPDFDYYITMDYDACINVDLDKMIEKISSEAIDFVAQPIPPSNTWQWIKPHERVYLNKKINGYLLCVTVMSKKAANYLWQRRRDMATAYESGQVPYWPFCEVFCAMELSAEGFRVGNLSNFGDTTHYSFSPAHSERTAASLTRESFVHPVLDKPRFLKSLITYQHPFSDLFRAGSKIRQQLAEYPALDYIPLIAKEAVRRLKKTYHRKVSAS